MPAALSVFGFESRVFGVFPGIFPIREILEEETGFAEWEGKAMETSAQGKP